MALMDAEIDFINLNFYKIAMLCDLLFLIISSKLNQPLIDLFCVQKKLKNEF